MTKIRNIILDTDLGNDVDDILAIIMLAQRRDINLVGITTVYGDTSLQTKMVRYILDRLGRTDVPVIKGETTPMKNLFGGILRGHHVASGFPLALHEIQERNVSNAVDFIINQAHLYNGELELVPIGPLTNLGMAFQKDPSIKAKIKKITTMSGVFTNEMAVDSVLDLDGEYNIVCDIEASQIVIDSGVPIRMVPLDVTRQVLLTEKELKIMQELPHGLGSVVEKEIKTWWSVQLQWNPAIGFANHLHDPLAILALFDTTCLEYKRGEISSLIRISPLVCASNPVIKRKIVDLPQPDGPTKTQNSPSLTSKSTPLITWTSPYDLVIFFNFKFDIYNHLVFIIYCTQTYIA